MEKEELTNSEESNKEKSDQIMNAPFIGLLIGVIFYGAVKNTWGFAILLPLFLLYKLLNQPKKS